MAKTEAPPRSGSGSGKDNWVEFAKANDLEIGEDDTKDDIIAKAEAAGLLSDGDASEGDTPPDEGEGDESAPADTGLTRVARIVDNKRDATGVDRRDLGNAELDATDSKVALENDDEAGEITRVDDATAGGVEAKRKLAQPDAARGGVTDPKELEAAQPDDADHPRRDAAPAVLRQLRTTPSEETTVLDEDLVEAFVPGRSRRASHRLVASAGIAVPNALIKRVEENNAEVEKYLDSLKPPAATLEPDDDEDE